MKYGLKQLFALAKELGLKPMVCIEQGPQSYLHDTSADASVIANPSIDAMWDA